MFNSTAVFSFILPLSLVAFFIIHMCLSRICCNNAPVPHPTASFIELIGQTNYRCWTARNFDVHLNNTILEQDSVELPQCHEIAVNEATVQRSYTIEPALMTDANETARNFNFHQYNVIMTQHSRALSQYHEVAENEARLPSSDPSGPSRIALINEIARNFNFNQNTTTIDEDSLELPQYQELVVDDLPSYNEAMASFENFL